MAMTSHELGRRLLELPDHLVLTVDGDVITEASKSTYDTEESLDLPCISLETDDGPE